MNKGFSFVDYLLTRLQRVDFLKQRTCLILFVFVTQTTDAAFSVVGRVQSQSVNIPGVLIKNQLGPEFTTSDNAGNFQLQIQGDTASLTFTHISYLDKTVPLSNKGMQAAVNFDIRVSMILRTHILQEASIQPFEQGKQHFPIDPFNTLHPRQLQNFNQTSILPAINTIPGVQMDSRGFGGSRRISIRGSALRSPFGVRNIKAYWNGIPLTGPDGATPLEVIDVSTIRKLNILKGPSGSIYGSGTGGVLLFRTRDRLPASKAGAFSTVGSDGLFRVGGHASWNEKKWSIQAAYVRSRLDGYRSQEAVQKDFLELHGTFAINKASRLYAMAYYYDGLWELPGALDSTQVDDAPRQAVEFSETANAHVYRKRMRVGLSYTYADSSGITNTTAIYANTTDKVNPFGTSAFFNGHKVEQGNGAGGRTNFSWENSQLKLIWGAEAQWEQIDLVESDNLEGQAGPERINTQTESSTGFLFVQTELKLPAKFHLNAGMSLNFLQYDHQDNFTNDSIDFSLTRSFSPQLLPRLALSKEIHHFLIPSASVGFGYSPPTVWEVQNPDGSINEALTPERGINYEYGVKGNSTFSRYRTWYIGYSISNYLMQLDNAILPQQLDDGSTVFQNSGKADQLGVEAAVEYRYWFGQNTWSISIRPTYAYQRYRFKEYIKEGDDFSDNAFPGVPVHTLNNQITLNSKWGASLLLTHRWLGKTPLNDANTAFAPSYHLLSSQLKWNVKLKQSQTWKLEIFAGSDNLLNATYSSFLQLNGVRGRYFNPSAQRTFYAGISLSHPLK